MFQLDTRDTPSPRRRTMRNVNNPSARKRQKVEPKVQSVAPTAAKMLTLLQIKVEEHEQKEQTIKDAGEILQNFRTN